MYGERGLATRASLVWLSEETLTGGYGEEPLAHYTVKADRKEQLTTVIEPRLLPTAYRSARA